MEDWEDEDFEPGEVGKIAPTTDKWEGEDEEEDVKDNWDDDDEKPPEEPTEKKPPETKPTKRKLLAKKLKEKEEKEAKALEEKRLAELQKTPEEKMQDKLLAQKLAEESDLEIAKDTFNTDFLDVNKDTIDSFNGTTKEEFTNFEEMLSEKICQFESSPHYQSLLENLFRNCCLGLNAESIKKIVSSLTVLQNEKAKQERQKKGGKKPTKAKLTGGSKGGARDDIIDYSYDDFDDIM